MPSQMMPRDPVMLAFISMMAFISVFTFIYYGWTTVIALLARQQAYYQRVLVNQLLIDIPPRAAVIGAWVGVLLSGVFFYIAMQNYMWFFVGAAIGVFVPNVVVRHLDQKRREKLELQIVDGITVIASGVRAGLNMVQAFELLVKNSPKPISQEFAQLLREYQMGLDLNHAMRNAANRIGSSHYRLLFTAIEMHRVRGGDAGESMDRIAESIREIQRLEGKLDALTAQGRTQARMMGLMPVALLIILYGIDPDGVMLLFTESLGRAMLLVSAVLVVTGFWWIRKIMAIDI